MNSNQFRQLLDFAIEYLPEAQQARAHDKQFGKDYRRINHGGYNRHLLDVLLQIFQDPTLTAIEFAAAELLQALCVCRLKFPEVAGIGIIPQAKHDKWRRNIADAAKTLAELTGKKIPFDYIPAAKDEYVPLLPLLVGHWDKPLSELPEELRARVSLQVRKRLAGHRQKYDASGELERDAEGHYPVLEEVYAEHHVGDFMFDWDALTPWQRQEYARQIDARHAPKSKAEAEEEQYYFNLACKKYAIEKEIRECELMHHRNIPSEAKIQRERLSELRAELEDIKQRFKLPPPDATAAKTEAVPLATPVPAEVEAVPVESPRGGDVEEQAPVAEAPGESSDAAGKVEAGAGTTPAPVTRTNKQRRNNLDPAIEKAIKQAGNMELADVYLKLKELVLVRV